MKTTLEEMNRIETWLFELPHQPHIEHQIVTNGEGQIVDVKPEAIQVVDREAMLTEWRILRRDIGV